ncbi:hypothetical protein JCM10212_004362, partial [Sporobolomyces blumeae]
VDSHFSTSCTSWLSRRKWLAIVPAGFASTLHLVLVGFLAVYVERRPDSSAKDAWGWRDVERARDERKKDEKSKRARDKRRRKGQDGNEGKVDDERDDGEDHDGTPMIEGTEGGDEQGPAFDQVQRGVGIGSSGSDNHNNDDDDDDDDSDDRLGETRAGTRTSRPVRTYSSGSSDGDGPAWRVGSGGGATDRVRAGR